MGIQRFIKSAGPARVYVEGKIQGANTDAPTISEGTGFTVARTGTGAWTITFTKSYAALVAFTWGLQASTPADVKGHTVIVDDLASGTTLPLVIYNASDAAHDLVATEYLTFTAVFRAGAVSK